MRIIGGKFKGRRFDPPADNWPTRPTTDYAKEALFNILNNLLDFENSRVLDLFGGTGSHSYEFVSRGCQDVTYVDKFPQAVKFVRQTVGKLGIESQVKIFQMDVFRFIESASSQWDYIFAGPPYALPTIDAIPDLILSKNLLLPDGILVLEHNPHHDFLQHPHLVDVRNYGKTIFSFFKPLTDNEEE
ncbi:MAG: RsmD family RNA methyltransferase [Saprospiraceae bacterium]|nr:RsmD family RNA methyltransferase [Saprospiraceae bacterium]